MIETSDRGGMGRAAERPLPGFRHPLSGMPFQPVQAACGMPPLLLLLAPIDLMDAFLLLLQDVWSGISPMVYAPHGPVDADVS